MRTKRLALLTPMIVLGLALTACGGDDDGGDSDAGDAETTQAQAPDEPSEISGDVQTWIDACKDAIKQGAAAALSEDAVSKLEAACEKIEDEEGYAELSKEICVTIVEDSMPEGAPGRETALEACETQSG